MTVASSAETIVPVMQTIYEFRGPLPLSCFDEANAQWYEDMVRSRESEKWSREAMWKSFLSLGLDLLSETESNDAP